MNKRIANKLVKLENSRNQLLAQLDKIDAYKLTLSPAVHKWSVTQVMYHLYQAESLSVVYVSKKRQDPNLKKSGLYEVFKIWIVRLGFWLPIKYKAPAVLGEMPENVNYTEIKTKWNETREKLRELINSLPEDMLSKKVFKQPAAGRLNIYQMIDFMQAHFNRHLQQIQNNLRH